MMKRVDGNFAIPVKGNGQDSGKLNKHVKFTDYGTKSKTGYY